MQRIADATFTLIGRTGRVDPTLRDILRETGLSTQAFYRYFRSKDELLLLLLDDGRRRLVGYLEHRMARASKPADQIREWIAGVLAQAGDPQAASRTLPFFINEDRLAEAFPDEQRASVELLVNLLVAPITKMGRDGPTAKADATAVYRLSFATLKALLIDGRTAKPAEVAHLVAFAVGGIERGRERS